MATGTHERVLLLGGEEVEREREVGGVCDFFWLHCGERRAEGRGVKKTSLGGEWGKLFYYSISLILT